MKVTIAGLDIAKDIFHVVCFDERFKELRKRMLRRNQVLSVMETISTGIISGLPRAFLAISKI